MQQQYRGGVALIYSFDAQAQTLVFDTKFTAPDGDTGDNFGSSVAIDGNLALIGSRFDINGGGSGSAYLFDTTTGSLLQKLTAPDVAAGDQFGFSVAIDGNLALIGSFLDDDNGTNSGSAYLFDTTTGSLLQKLTAPDAASNDEFGRSVAIDGNLALIGAPDDDDDNDNALNTGSAYLFDTSTGSLLQKLTAPDAAVGEQFGFSVAIDGNQTLIGAPFDDDNGASSGSAYLFDTSTGNLLQKLTAPDGASNDNFGLSVGIDGNRVLIGAFNNLSVGASYLFDAVTGNFQQKLTAPDGAADDEFGNSVAISGNQTLIGSFGDDDNGSASGSAYLFTPNNTATTPEPSFLLGFLGLGTWLVTSRKGK